MCSTGAELSVLESFEPSANGGVSVGIVVVEMRFNDARRNFRTLRRLASMGFELVRALRVWSDRIMDLVFVNPQHFMRHDGAVHRAVHSTVNGTVFPRDASTLLHKQVRNFPPGANMRFVRGRLGGRYVVPPPISLFTCAVWETRNETQPATSINATSSMQLRFVRMANESTSMC